MEHKYILNYFPVTGTAEACRMAFHFAGVKFTDNQIPFPEWGKYKADGNYICVLCYIIVFNLLFLYNEIEQCVSLDRKDG